MSRSWLRYATHSSACRRIATSPRLVKIAPDLAADDIDAVADMALRLSLDGHHRDQYHHLTQWRAHTCRAHRQIGAGGLSGAPLRERSLQELRRLSARTGARILLIGVGGIRTAHDVLQRILAGATLVRAYTGFVDGGPLWPRHSSRALARLLRERGFSSVRAAIGKG